MMRPVRIIRSRTGCFSCRRRKKKCNEEKPICSGCRRNALECSWPTESCKVLHSKTNPKASVVPSATSTATKCIGSQYEPYQRDDTPRNYLTPPSPEAQPMEQEYPHYHVNPPQRPSSTFTTSPTLTFTSPRPRSSSNASSASDTHNHVPSPSHTAACDPGKTATISPDSASLAPSPLPRYPTSATRLFDESDTESSVLHDNRVHSENALSMILHPSVATVPATPESTIPSINAPLSLLPSSDHDSLELLSYYLSRTADSMGNGSTDINPFIAKLVPLAFSNPLVLQLLLAQSASHRQAAANAPSGHDILGNEVAQKYYTDSLRMFRNVVDEYMSGKEENALVLTVGSLTLCLTEVARGDKDGTIFDHLKASESMLTLLVNRPSSDVPSDLADFLVEYYMHMTAASMISTRRKHKVPVLSPEIEALAKGLVNKGYVGQLCGCWLELLLIIPQIFNLGQRMILSNEDNQQLMTSPDDIISFGFLQSQVIAFVPDLAANMYSRLAALVFKQAVLLYLWSLIQQPTAQDRRDAAGSTTHKHLMEMAVSEAVSLLDQFPATLRINTSLCWPLAVIGCCTDDVTVQGFLRQRLQTMVNTIGLGNMRETLALLEYVWQEPTARVSPWNLAQFMQEHRIWISFA